MKDFRWARGPSTGYYHTRLLRPLDGLDGLEAFSMTNSLYRDRPDQNSGLHGPALSFNVQVVVFAISRATKYITKLVEFSR